ncbi:MAG: chemotaxis protein CheX [Clostridia bacterium]|nr:chemotaxis protein CheX [Clostridia bacterium]
MEDEKNMTSEFQALNKNFTNAVLDVIVTMTGMEPDLLAEAIKDENTGGISASMTLVSSRNILATLGMQEEAARFLVSYMTGLSEAELTGEDLCDGIAELVNMICGRAKTFLADTEFGFKLTSPFVIIGDSYRIVQKKNVVKQIKSFHVGEHVITWELAFP